MKSILFLGAAVVLGLSAPALAADSPGKPPAAIGAWGVDTGGLSKTVRPGDDFYRYVNEGWLKTAKMPPGLSALESFTEAYLSTEQRVLGIIKEAREGNDAPGTPEQQIADYYRSFADMEKRNALGITPLASTLSIIAGTKDRADLARLMAMPSMEGLIGAGVTTDATEPRRQIGAVAGGGLTMPTRDYYLDPSPANVAFRKAFQDYVAATYRRAGVPDADARAAKVLALETAIAKEQWTTAQLRDVVAMNNVMTPAELKAYAPGFPWDAFLAEMKLDGQPKLKVLMDSSVRANAKLFAETPVEDIRSWLMFKTLDRWSPFLSEPWVQAHFEFHQKTLSGVSERRPAELEAVAAVNAALGEEIGRIYVAEYFGAADKARVQELIGYLRREYGTRIKANPWMDEPTRKEALAKLEKIVSHIGYPDRWHDRSNIRIAADDLVGNRNRMLQWDRDDSLKKLAEGTRDWEFPYVPQEINAGYAPSLNSITFPAGILQAPFFDAGADAAVQFGSTAAVIGHEIGHAFDDQGSRSDGEGKLRNWWTPQARAEFEKRTAGLVDQFNQYEPVPGVKINGRQNLGENIGDLGGLSVAYAAYRKYVDEKQGGKAPVIDGFTGDQRFFMAWAQVWRNLMTEAEARRRTLGDVHSAGEFRTNGIVRNVDGWYQAFGVKPGDKLYLPPDKRVKIW
jgi:endothelin-converting enzyme/putative endopeptidase